jgi:ribose transport system substrate-binding protein
METRSKRLRRLTRRAPPSYSAPCYNRPDMKRISWILALVFGLVFAGATLMNATLIGKARGALSGIVSGGDGEARPSAGAGAKAEDARFHLIVIVPDTDDSFYEGLLEGISSAVKGADAAEQVFRYPLQSPQEAERYFEIALRSKVDGLIMYTPRNGSPSAPSAGRAEKAADSGLVFVPVGTDAPPGEKGPFIGSGSLLQGLQGGKLIGQKLGGSARIGVILPASDRGAAEAEPLYRGVVAALKAFPGASVSAVAEVQPGILSGEAVAESMLRDHPGLNAILCSSARDTVGAAQVLIDLNEVGKVLIVGADETQDIRRYIDKGVISASIVRDSKMIGEEAVKAFSRIKTGGSPPGPQETGFFIIKKKEGGQ